jgi:hypothetical protein
MFNNYHLNDTKDWFTSFFFEKCLKNVGQDSMSGIVQLASKKKNGK